MFATSPQLVHHVWGTNVAGVEAIRAEDWNGAAESRVFASEIAFISIEMTIEREGVSDHHPRYLCIESKRYPYRDS